MTLQSIIVGLFSGQNFNADASCMDSSRELKQENLFQVWHQRSWTDLRYNAEYCLAYNFNSVDYRKSTNQKSKTVINGSFQFYHEYWGEVYKNIVLQNQPLLSNLQDSLYALKMDKSLDKTEFANAIVKMVQDIPYAYIMSDECERVSKDYDCIPHQKFGLTSPVEFLYTLKGDCDSRTVLLYSLFKHFGIDALVMISKEYLHSVIAVSIPAGGKHIIHKDQKFYFWETTASGWEAGILPPDMKNIKYWKIALDHE